MTYRIRPITTQDDTHIAGVIRSVMPEFGADGPGFAIHDDEVNTMSTAYAIPRAAYFVVELNGTVQGGGGIAPLLGGDGDTCELRKMYFLPSLRGMGAGKAMIELCLSTARKFGFKHCYLETLTGMNAAKHLYQAFGFVSIPKALGGTGHFSCDSFFIREL